MFALFYTFLYINDVKKRIHVLAKPQRSSLRIHLCASERSERAIFGVFNSFTVKKVNFFTINVKFKVILSSKSVGGGGGREGGYIPPSPRIYASAIKVVAFFLGHPVYIMFIIYIAVYSIRERITVNTDICFLSQSPRTRKCVYHPLN